MTRKRHIPILILGCALLTVLPLSACAKGDGSAGAAGTSADTSSAAAAAETGTSSVSSSASESVASSGIESPGSSVATSSLSTAEPVDLVDPSEAGYDAVDSESGHFSFEGFNNYLTREEADGSVVILLCGEENTLPVIRVNRLEISGAKEYLDQRNVPSYPGDESLLPVEKTSAEDAGYLDRQMLVISGQFDADGTIHRFTQFAEDLPGGGLLSYLGVYAKEDEDYVLESLESAISSMTIDGTPVREAWEKNESGGDTENPDTDELSATSTPGIESGDYGTVEGTGTLGRFSYVLSKLPNGDLEYCFDEALLVDIPEFWDGKITLVPSPDGRSIAFCHTASYEQWKAEGLDGGRLFSIGFSEDESYKTLPHYQDLGPAKDGYYFFDFPTDVQGYAEDEETMAEWQALMADMDYVESSAYSTLPG